MAYRSDPPTIPLESIAWEEIGEDGDDKARLLAHICIGPLNMHLEAWAIDENETERQIAIPASMRTDDLEKLNNMMDCSFQELEIDGRFYVLVATPYGD